MRTIRVGLVGAGWMGKSHASAFRNAALVFGGKLPRAVLHRVADVDINSARTLALANGCESWTTDWREVVEDPEVDVVDITTPNDTHFLIARAAISAGKHIYCEKPLTLNAMESAILTEEAHAARITTLVGFNYLKIPRRLWRGRSLAQARSAISCLFAASVTAKRWLTRGRLSAGATTARSLAPARSATPARTP